MKSDADIIRDAKLEAMGLPPAEDNEPHRGNRPRHDRPQMATDEMVRVLNRSSFCPALTPTVPIFLGHGAVQEADAKVVVARRPMSLLVWLFFCFVLCVLYISCTSLLSSIIHH